jgi:hypothetical protein
MRDHGYFAKLRTFLLNRRRSQRKRPSKSMAGPANRPESRFSIELLESRMLLSADLAAAVQAVQIVPEQTATVLVTNNGPDRVNNPTITARASLDNSLDAGDVLLGSSTDRGSNGPGNLGAGQSGQASIKLNFASLAPGGYRLLGVVNDVGKPNGLDNVGIGPTILKDTDGTVSMFKLTGPGQVELLADGSQWDVRVTGTTAQSLLTIQTSGGKRARHD